VDFATHFRPVLEQLGEPAVYVHGTGTGASTGTLTGIYRAPYQPIVLGGVSVDATEPTFCMMSADVPNLARGDTITLRGITYKVRVAKPDSVPGITRVELEGP
jgi:hypothetical protein